MRGERVNGTLKAYAQSFVNGYIECAVWSSTDDNGEPLDCGKYDVSAQFKRIARADCLRFIKANLVDLEAFAEQYSVDPSCGGHDFWLTRNRHGVGFWDRGLEPELSKRLTDAAHAEGELYLYVYRKRIFQA